jgi:hypothetical protein
MAEKKIKFEKFVGEVEHRPGVKAPWIEIVLVKKDGERIKLIARKVNMFHSEMGENKTTL